MLGLQLPKKEGTPLHILCLGAHPDDIEIGCGGTLLYLKHTLPSVRLHWVVFTARDARAQEATKAFELFAAGCEKKIILKQYRDGFLPYHGAQVKESFEELKMDVNPDLIFCPWRGDAHQDHRLISELTWNTFRNHLILEYEIPKYDGDIGRPNLFVPLDRTSYETKVGYLFEAFASQQSKPWFDRQLFMGLMRIRGMECNAPSDYAEAFHVRKAVLG